MRRDDRSLQASCATGAQTDRPDSAPATPARPLLVVLPNDLDLPTLVRLQQAALEQERADRVALTERLMQVEGAIVALLTDDAFKVNLARAVKRMARRSGSRLPRIVGTPYVAVKLGCTTKWVTEMLKRGDIPTTCIAKKGGDGGYWKFHRRKIDRWIKQRRRGSGQVGG